MGIWDRLGNVIKSYINDGIGHVSGDDHRSWRKNEDNDYNDAYEELEGFLRGEAGNRSSDDETRFTGKKAPPEYAGDFAELGLDLRATEAECKDAYKKLLKIHHPDRHSGNPELLRKATEKTARINAAYDRITNWFKSGL